MYALLYICPAYFQLDLAQSELDLLMDPEKKEKEMLEKLHAEFERIVSSIEEKKLYVFKSFHFIQGDKVSKPAYSIFFSKVLLCPSKIYIKCLNPHFL